MKLLFIFFILPFLFAFKFNPMSQSIDLGSGQKSVQFIAENESDENMAIEFTVKNRVMKSDGTEELPDTSDVSIFPPQLIIPPKEKRTIRVSWQGKTPQSELAFRVIAEQLPLNVNGKKQVGIKMLMRYIAALYVTPKDVESKIESRIETSTKNELKLALKNTGKKHQLLVNPTLTFKKDKKKWVLKGNQLDGLRGENILSGVERFFTLKTKENIPADSEINLKLEE